MLQLTDLPQQAKTKKELIRDLVLSGHPYSADEIANMVHTTKENVWKEKSKMAAEGLIVGRTATKKNAERKDGIPLLLPSSANSGGEANSKLKSTARSRYLPLKRKSRSDEDHYLRHLNISPVDSEGMKIMYKEFKNKKPVDIIAEHAFPPTVVEVEYKRFLRLEAIDIQKLQTFLGDQLVKYPLEGLKWLEDKYKQTHSLTNDEMIEVVKAIIKFKFTTNSTADQNIT